MMPKTLDLNIEELVLEGLDGVNRAYVGTVVERELGRLFTERGIPPSLAQGGAVESVDGGAFTVAPSADTDALGAQIAQTVYTGLNR